MKEEKDAILRASGDLLLQLGCDTGWLVPNSALNTKQLNASIAKYQERLDTMELEVIRSIQLARERAAAPPPPVKMEEASQQDQKPDAYKQATADIEMNVADELANAELASEQAGRPSGLDDEAMGFFDLNNTDDLFGDAGSPSSNYGLMEDQFFQDR